MALYRCGSSKGGTAQPADVLVGKTFTNDDDYLSGTMPNNGVIGKTLGYSDSYTIPAGYTSGGVVTSPEDRYNTGYNAGKTDYNPTGASLTNAGALTVTNAAGTSRLTKTFSNNYDSGYSNGNAKGYSDGYSKGYSDGVAAGFTKSLSATYNVYRTADTYSGDWEYTNQFQFPITIGSVRVYHQEYNADGSATYGMTLQAKNTSGSWVTLTTASQGISGDSDWTFDRSYSFTQGTKYTQIRVSTRDNNRTKRKNFVTVTGTIYATK